MNEQVIIAGVGLLVAAVTGVTGLGVQRLLTKTDVLTEVVGEHSVALAEMKLKMPNGEWREIKDSLAEAHGDIRELKGDVQQLAVDCRSSLLDRRRTRAAKKAAKR